MALLSKFAASDFSETIIKKQCFSEKHARKEAKTGKPKTLTFDTFENKGLLKNTVLLQLMIWTKKGLLKKKQQKQEVTTRKQQNNQKWKEHEFKKGRFGEGNEK